MQGWHQSSFWSRPCSARHFFILFGGNEVSSDLFLFFTTAPAPSEVPTTASASSRVPTTTTASSDSSTLFRLRQRSREGILEHRIFVQRLGTRRDPSFSSFNLSSSVIFGFQPELEELRFGDWRLTIVAVSLSTPDTTTIPG